MWGQSRGVGSGWGATEIKSAKKSFWGFGGTVQAPDGTLWKVATGSFTDPDGFAWESVGAATAAAADPAAA